MHPAQAKVEEILKSAESGTLMQKLDALKAAWLVADAEMRKYEGKPQLRLETAMQIKQARATLNKQGELIMAKIKAAGGYVPEERDDEMATHLNAGNAAPLDEPSINADPTLTADAARRKIQRSKTVKLYS